MTLRGFTLLCEISTALNLQISPVDNTSQYKALKTEMSGRRIAQPAEPVNGLSFELEIFFTFHSILSIVFCHP
jgi:hypothetical protein